MTDSNHPESQPVSVTEILCRQRDRFLAYFQKRAPLVAQAHLVVEDLYQELVRTFLRSRPVLPRVQTSTAAIRVLYVMARRQLRKIRRRLQARPTEVALVSQELPERVHLTEDVRQQFEDLLKAASEFEQQIVRLKLDGHSNTAVAQLLGIQEYHVRRAFVALRNKVPHDD